MRENKNTTFMYILIDPLDNNVRYVGKSNNTVDRLNAHIKRLKGTTHKENWIRNLLSKNVKPIMEVIDEVPKIEWEFWETHYVSLYKSWGFDLTNATPGGNHRYPGNALPFMSKETKKKLSDINTGKKQSLETISKRVAKLIGHKTSQETRDKISKANKGHKLTKEHIAKITNIFKKGQIAYNKGKKEDAEFSRKVKEGMKNGKIQRLTTKAIDMYNIDGYLKTFSGITQASIETKISKATIGRILKGKKEHFKNIYWKYNQNGV